MTAQITLEDGTVVSVDQFDLTDLTRFKWTKHPAGYAYSWIDGRMQLMHRYIMNADAITGDGLEIDHIDQDKTNNTRSNLRFVTRRQNKLNQTEKRTLARGVNLRNIRQRTRGSWQVRFIRRPEEIVVGSYSTLEEAIVARDNWLKLNE